MGEEKQPVFIDVGESDAGITWSDNMQKGLGKIEVSWPALDKLNDIGAAARDHLLNELNSEKALVQEMLEFMKRYEFFLRGLFNIAEDYLVRERVEAELEGLEAIVERANNVKKGRA